MSKLIFLILVVAAAWWLLKRGQLGFAVLVVAVAYAFPVLNPEHQLKLLKDVAFGALQLFAVVIAISATAVLLPRDVEDRTLYTILAKPVPRADYLVGKLLGVLAEVWMRTGEPQRSIPLLRQRVSLLQKVQPGSESLSRAEAALGNALFFNDQWDAADAQWRQALPAAEHHQQDGGSAWLEIRQGLIGIQHSRSFGGGNIHPFTQMGTNSHEGRIKVALMHGLNDI